VPQPANLARVESERSFAAPGDSLFPAQGAVAWVRRDFLWGAGLKPKLETWRRFWNLNAHSRRLVLEAAAVLAATWAGLRLMGYPRWRRVMKWLAPGTTKCAGVGDSAVIGTAHAIARFEQSAARHLFLRTNCLEQSLALCWLLRRRGIAAALRIGARKESGRFEAHAWVELEGAVLNEAQEQHRHFAPFNGPVTSLETQVP